MGAPLILHSFLCSGLRSTVPADAGFFPGVSAPRPGFALAASSPASCPAFWPARSARPHAHCRHPVRHAQWARYIACHVLPDVQSEAAVNTYITEWGEAPRQELEPALAECERTAALLSQLDDAHSLALRRPAASRGARALWYPAALAALGRMTIAKLDEVTAHILANADERATSRNELQLCGQAASHKYALWLNLARNPRVKVVELPEVAVSFELPKALALASVAIRVVQFRAEHAMPSLGVPSPYQTVGGILLLELLQLPPVPKRVKGWTLRQVGPTSHTVTRMAYPLPQLGSEPSAGAAAPLRLSIVLPADVVVPEEMVRVGWWDTANGQWALEGISDIRYEPETRQLSLLTVHLCGLAVLQPTHAELPYSRWLLKPMARSRSVGASPAPALRSPKPAPRRPAARLPRSVLTLLPSARSPRASTLAARPVLLVRRCWLCRRRTTAWSLT